MATRKKMSPNIAHLFDKPVIQLQDNLLLDKNNAKKVCHLIQTSPVMSMGFLLDAV